MNTLPLELSKEIGYYIHNVNDQLQCTLVCRPWREAFQALLYQHVVFEYPDQIDEYIQQRTELKRFTTSFEFGCALKEGQLRDLGKTCPNINSFSMFDEVIEEAHQTTTDSLSWGTAASIIKEYWIEKLVKADIEDQLLFKLISGLKDQLVEVRSLFWACFDDDENLIPMPQLRRLTLLELEDLFHPLNNMSTKQLDEIHIAYTKLEEMELHFAKPIEPFEDDDSFICTPFPLLRSLFIKKCSYDQDMFIAWGKMIKHLTSLKIIHPLPMDSYSSFLDTNPDPFSQFLMCNSNINDLYLHYYPGMCNENGFPALKKLIHPTTLVLRTYLRTSVISQREWIDFDLLISSTQCYRTLSRWSLSSLYRRAF